MSPSFILIAVLLQAMALSIIMSGAWLVQQRTGNSGWVDTVWTFGLGLVGIVSALVPLQESQFTERQIVVAIAVGIWSLRLGLHISHRSAGIQDDPRYAELSRKWGANASRQMFWLLQKQAIVTIPMALSIFLAARNSSKFASLDAIAIIILLIAIAGEALADLQLRMFRRDPRNEGRVCDQGLWSYSRHPNYFFEWLGWLAYPLMAGLSGWELLSLLGPICMYWLLVYVSGVPPLEEHMLRSRGDAYREYQQNTNTFFPGPSRGEARRVVG